MSDESFLSREFRERWFKMLLSSINHEASRRTLEEIELMISQDSLIRGAILSIFQNQVKFPDGNFWKIGEDGRIDKAIVFFERNKEKPFHLKSSKGKKFNVYMNYNLKEMLDEINLDSILLQNPIKFSIIDGRFIADFNPTSGQSRTGIRGAGRADIVLDIWGKHLSKEYGVTNAVLNRLKGRLGYGCGIDLFYPQEDEELLKLFVMIITEFKRNCDKAMDFLTKKIQLVGNFDINWSSNYVKNHSSELESIEVDLNRRIKIGDKELDLYLGQLKKYGRTNPTWETDRSIYSLETRRTWLQKHMNEIKKHAMETIFKKSVEAYAEKFSILAKTN